MTAARPSEAEHIRNDSLTNVFAARAMQTASSMSVAYCSISLARMETGVADIFGVSSFEALMDTVRPFSFIPERTPVMPGQVTDT